MSSVYKTLNISDLTVFPYKTSKAFSFSNTTTAYTNSGIQVYYGSSLPLPQSGSTYYQQSINYRSVRHLYYSHNLPGLQPPTPLSEQSYIQLVADQNVDSTVNPVLIYDNYLQTTACSGSAEYDNRETFPTSSVIYVTATVSIPQALFGEQIKPGTFTLVSTDSDFPNSTDDSNGNLVDINDRVTVVGNIIYSHGIIIVTNSEYSPANGDFTLSFTSETTVYQSQVRCHINENEFNMTINPSATSGSFGALNSNVSGSSFQPYVTTVGLYNGANELIAVGKLGQPFPMPANTDVTFVVRWDS
jgi:hypothetical protein